jgi:hypothetical protein
MISTERQRCSRAAAVAFARERQILQRMWILSRVKFSIRNAIGHGFSPVFMGLVAAARIEGFFLDTRDLDGSAG